ncbi:Acetyltransferase (GNAT) family [Phytophthora cinnamomi]|uniref:Acetyltransferase (GNAT) family n=1 Tax=Phytophthora cinnamomi TaxID=4785 RepID=UPI00355940AE|nr:Acetyltransferase (GNAT) family [Phytophthora cinnamomi]
MARRSLSSSCKSSKQLSDREAAGADGTRPVAAVMAAGDVVFGPVDKSNVQRLRELNLQLFPVRYNLAFYKEVVSSPPGYAQIACVGGGFAVGAICCRREPVEGGSEGLERTYIMTLGVLEGYRRARIGSRLLEGVVAQSIRDGVVQVYLHVQTSNAAALRFYLAHGFEATQILRNYYKGIEPPDCYVLRRQLIP